LEECSHLKPNSITLSGRKQVRSWSQTSSELEFGLSSSLLTVTRFEQVRAISTNLVADRFEAKFHYADYYTVWSQTGPRLVADLLARASLLLAS